jgi:signal transduction histidine kinase/DNA-binding response OmpR family regulator
VQGSNNEEIFNEPGTSIRIDIARPPWKTWWAYLIYAVVAGFGGFAILKYFDEKKRMRQKLLKQELKAQQFAEIEKVKSQFFANISHEFRTPITLIKGRVDELLDELKRFDLKEKVFSIEQNAAHLLELIDQLLDLTRLESKNMRLHMIAGDLVLFLKELVRSFQPLALSRNLTLEFHSEQETIITEFDADAMKKVVSNLVSNALKFTPKNGNVKVYLSELINEERSKAPQKDKRLRIRVVDDGIGIPEKELDSVFNRYYQVENKKGYETGFGLGLALVKELIDLLGGDIKVESQENRGTTFIVEIPLLYSGDELNTDVQMVLPSSGGKITKESSKFKQKLPQSDFSYSLSSKLILVVEDHLEMQRFIHDILKPEYRVILAGNGKKGLEMALKEIPDLIISDVKMPEMDGFEFTRQLTSDQRTSHIPIILLTARTHVKDRLAGLEMGADAYLVKPFKKDELLIRVKSIIRKREILTKKNTGKMMADARFDEITSIDQEFLQKVQKIVEEKLGNEQFNVEALASEIGMSASNLYRKVQALLDITPVQLIQQFRFKRAILLLKKGYNISEVSWRVGFKSQANFSTSFKKQFGCSPREYLKGK